MATSSPLRTRKLMKLLLLWAFHIAALNAETNWGQELLFSCSNHLYKLKVSSELLNATGGLHWKIHLLSSL